MLIISKSLWSLLIDNIRSVDEPLEQIAFLDGVRNESACIATTLTLPDADCTPLNYSISGEQMRKAGEHLRPNGLVRVAQVHTHPSKDVRHSPYDDRFSYSHLEGAISIVLPDYGLTDNQFDKLGVHIYQRDRWQIIASDKVTDFIKLVPGVIDLRSTANGLDIWIKTK